MHTLGKAVGRREVNIKVPGFLITFERKSASVTSVVMISRVFSITMTVAIENLFLNSKELELQNDLREQINHYKQVMFENPTLNLKVYYSIAMQKYRKGKEETLFCPIRLKKKGGGGGRGCCVG